MLVPQRAVRSAVGVRYLLGLLRYVGRHTAYVEVSHPIHSQIQSVLNDPTYDSLRQRAKEAYDTAQTHFKYRDAARARNDRDVVWDLTKAGEQCKEEADRLDEQASNLIFKRKFPWVSFVYLVTKS
jgi:oligoendopeptidase F